MTHQQVEALRQLYYQARIEVFYPSDEHAAASVTCFSPHHVWVHHAAKLAEAMAAAQLSAARICFRPRFALLSELRALFDDFVVVHRLPSLVPECWAHVRHRRHLVGSAVLASAMIVVLCLLRFIPTVYAHFPYAPWAPVTAAFVHDVGSTALTYRTGIQRILGTVIGGFLGFLGAWTVLQMPELVLIFAFIIAFLSGYVRGSPTWAYAGLVSAFTSQVVLFSAVYSTSVAQLQLLAFSRIELNFIGVLGSIIASAAWPTSARRAIVKTGIAKFQLIEQLAAAALDPWAPHPRHDTAEAYQAAVGALKAKLDGLVAGENALASTADEEPVMWRHAFDIKEWHDFLHAQNNLTQALLSLSVYVEIGSPSLALYQQWLSDHLSELYMELVSVIALITPLVSQGHVKAVSSTIRLPAASVALPVHITDICDRIFERVTGLLLQHRECVYQGAIQPIPNESVMPLTGFVVALREIATALDHLWHATYELYSRHRFIT